MHRAYNTCTFFFLASIYLLYLFPFSLEYLEFFVLESHFGSGKTKDITTFLLSMALSSSSSFHPISG